MTTARFQLIVAGEAYPLATGRTYRIGPPPDSDIPAPAGALDLTARAGGVDVRNRGPEVAFHGALSLRPGASCRAVAGDHLRTGGLDLEVGRVSRPRPGWLGSAVPAAVLLAGLAVLVGNRPAPPPAIDFDALLARHHPSAVADYRAAQAAESRGDRPAAARAYAAARDRIVAQFPPGGPAAEDRQLLVHLGQRLSGR
jgi:hypothetical protein